MESDSTNSGEDEPKLTNPPQIAAKKLARVPKKILRDSKVCSLPTNQTFKARAGAQCDCPDDECLDQRIPKMYKCMADGCSNQIHHMCFSEWVCAKHERESAWTQLEKNDMAVYCDVHAKLELRSVGLGYEN